MSYVGICLVKRNLETVQSNPALNLPIESRLISHDDYLFLSFHAISELFKIENGTLTPMDVNADATLAYKALNPVSPKKRTRRWSSNEIPPDVKEALSKLPPNTKLVADGKGGYRLAKKRKRN